jgi:hypothetical protein
VRRRLDAAVRGVEAAGPRDVALAAMVRAAGLTRSLYPGREHREDRDRLHRLGRGPGGEAVARAMAAVAAVDGAVAATGAVVASTTPVGHG